MESATNANQTVAEEVIRGLDAMRDEFGYAVSGGHVCLRFDPRGDSLTVVFEDDSALRIERQEHSHHGLAARVVRNLDAGRMPGPWEDV